MSGARGIVVFGVIGLGGFMAGISLVALGEPLEGIPSLVLGGLFLWRTWNDLRDWAG